MKQLEGKITGMFYVLVSRDYQAIARCGLRFRGYKELVEVVKQQEA